MNYFELYKLHFSFMKVITDAIEIKIRKIINNEDILICFHHHSGELYFSIFETKKENDEIDEIDDIFRCKGINKFENFTLPEEKAKKIIDLFKEVE